MWNRLKRIKYNANVPWLAIGDFNETLWQSEHYSATKRSEKHMADFREVLDWCELHDLGYKGPGWTFDNKQAGKNNVKARLDRGVATSCWNKWFPTARVEHICSTRSDHLPLLLKFGGKLEYRKKKVFRYEAMWEREGTLQPTVEENWNSVKTATNLREVQEKLCTMHQCLSRWSSYKIGSITRQTNKLRQRLEVLMNKTPNLQTDKEIKKVAEELDELLLREEIMWRQRSRSTYLREGDRNIDWFHRQATWRRKTNTISKLRNNKGQWIEEKGELNRMATNFFKELFTEDKIINPSELLGLFARVVTEDMNDELEKEFTEKEIGDALFQIGPLKAPGPDGFPARFYQRNWGVLKLNVVSVVQDFFQEWYHARRVE